VEILDVSPATSDDSPLGGGGTETWFFEHPLGPGASVIVLFEARALDVGRHVIELAACTFEQDCASVAHVLNVVEGPS
jgi:hypothetical protein